MKFRLPKLRDFYHPSLRPHDRTRPAGCPNGLSLAHASGLEPDGAPTPPDPRPLARAARHFTHRPFPSRKNRSLDAERKPTNGEQRDGRTGKQGNKERENRGGRRGEEVAF